MQDQRLYMGSEAPTTKNDQFDMGIKLMRAKDMVHEVENGLGQWNTRPHAPKQKLGSTAYIAGHIPVCASQGMVLCTKGTWTFSGEPRTNTDGFRQSSTFSYSMGSNLTSADA